MAKNIGGVRNLLIIFEKFVKTCLWTKILSNLFLGFTDNNFFMCLLVISFQGESCNEIFGWNLHARMAKIYKYMRWLVAKFKWFWNNFFCCRSKLKLINSNLNLRYFFSVSKLLSNCYLNYLNTSFYSGTAIFLPQSSKFKKFLYQ